MNALSKLIRFLDRLEAASLHYELGHFRESINVTVAVPGAHWEVEFFEDGHTEVEIFRSAGVESDPDSLIERLFAEYANGPTTEKRGHKVIDIEVEKVEPADEVVLEEWSRVTDEPELCGVGATRSDGEWPWQVAVSVMEFVRTEPLESELGAALSAALAAVPGVREAVHEDREIWIVKGDPDGPSLVRAAAAVVDRFSPRTRKDFDEG